MAVGARAILIGVNAQTPKPPRVPRSARPRAPRRGAIACWLVAVLALAGCGSLPPPPSLPVAFPAASPTPVAFTPGGLFGVAEAFRTNQTSLAYDAGVRWERLTFSWRDLQAGPGQPLNPGYLPRAYLDRERAHGIQIVGLIINTPAWAAEHPEQGGHSVPKGLGLPIEDRQNYWAQFVRRLVGSYAGTVDTWIVWNEPDITADASNAAYATWDGTPQDYLQLLRVASLTARAANPRVRIVSAALTYWTDIERGREQWFGRFLAALDADPEAVARGRYVDAVALNLYANPESLFTVPTLFHQLMREHGFDKPVWITEANVIPYDDPVNRGTANGSPSSTRVTMGEQASYLVQAFAMGMAAGDARIEVYKMKDGDGDVLNGQALVRADGTPRPEYAAYRMLAQTLAHARGTTLFAPGDLREVVVDAGPTRVTILWDAAPQSLRLEVPVSGDGTGQQAGPDGVFRPLRAQSGAFALQLPGATSTPPQPGAAPLVGGTPVVLVENAVATPVQPARAQTPPTLPPLATTAARLAGQPPTGALPPSGRVVALDAPNP